MTQTPSASSAYIKKVRRIHKALGIPASYANQSGIPLQPECLHLIDCSESDVFDRPLRMEKQTFNAWKDMYQNAETDGVSLQIVSAFRSVEYQQGLFEKKLAKGQLIEMILKVNAAPGYSEHHTGRALDITTPGFKALEEEFEKSEAYGWLTENARRFGFTLSYPRENPYGVLYEPWHWKFCSR